jgi:TetR/AcrR family transcriptional regulator
MSERSLTEVNGAESLNRKDRLLEAAIAEFSRSGLAGARIDSIARTAGVNKQLLYHYFGDKAQLEREVIAAVMHRSEEENAHYPESKSLKDRLAERLRRANTSPVAKLWGRLLAWEALEHGPDGTVHFEERRLRSRARNVEPVRQAQASGEIDEKFDPAMLALMLVAVEFMPRVLPNATYTLTGYKGDEPEFTERLIATMEALIARLGPQVQPAERTYSRSDTR